MHEILVKQRLTPVTQMYVVQALEMARKAQAGQFVIVRVHARGERIPLTIADYNRQQGTVTLVVQEVGKTTMHMGTMSPGDRLPTFVGPLGNPAEIRNFGTVLCVGGGSSIAAIYPLASALKAAGNTVIGIIGARTRALIFWEKRIRAVCDELIVCTDDGSHGRKGFVTLPLQEMLEDDRPIDHAFVVGPAVMMKNCARTTAPFGLLTTVSLNAIMVDGTGMCGGCRVTVGGQMRFACVDGPKFDGHQVDWDELLTRQRFYLDQERQAVEAWQQECHRLNNGEPCGGVETG